MQVPADYAAAASIVALAGCVGRRARIIPKEKDSSWSVVPNLWGAIVGPPGFMKSPVLHLATLPLARIEDQWRAEFEQDKKNFEREQGEAELRCQVWREQAREVMRKHLEPPEPPDEDLNEPVQRRLITTDATFEKLHSILADNPAGIVVVGDELTGWLAELERTGRDGICASSPIHGGGFLRRSPPGSED